MSSAYTKIALYASYQTGKDLPGYVRFALKHLAETDFHVVLLTNNRELSNETYEFLADNQIELFLTENHGFDFGMYRRYLQLCSNSATSTNNGAPPDTSICNIERLLLLNDSVIYYQNKFLDYFKQAEESSADVVSLTCSNEFSPHLLTFFLYMKQPALGAFYMFLFETPEQDTPQNLAMNLQFPLSDYFMDAGIHMDSLYQTEKQASFAYPELISQGAGFIKAKLLQGKFTYKEQLRFIENGEYESLHTNYAQLVKQAGMASDFDEKWLPTSLRETAQRKILWPALNLATKLKNKLIKKPAATDGQK